MTQGTEWGTSADSPTKDAEVIYFEGPLGPWRAGLMLPVVPSAARAEVWSGPRLMLLLEQAEPLVCAVEQWLQAPWELAPAAHAMADIARDSDSECPSVPSDVGDADTSGWCVCVVQAPALAPPGTRLRLPWNALNAVPPVWLQAPHVTWPIVEAEVCIDQVPQDALSGLTPGSLLWLEPSFQSPWLVTLRDVHHQLPPRAAQWNSALVQGGVLVLSRAGCTGSPVPEVGAVPSDAGPAADVLWDAPVRVPIAQWLGWTGVGSTVATQPLGVSTDGAAMPSLARLRLRQGASTLAHGGLFPVGQGGALRVEGTCLPEPLHANVPLSH